MAEKMNLAGRRYGRLTVLDNFIEFKNSQGATERKWLCRCDCGTVKYFVENNLKRGISKSCGCLRKENTRTCRVLDLEGKTFGELTVLEKMEERGPRGVVRWRCQCSCGAEHIADGAMLTAGRVKRCSNRKAHSPQMNFKTIDITGQRFGRLTALYPTDKRDFKSVVWHCRCDCGNEVDVPYKLLASNTKSCGCLKSELDQKMQEKLTHVAGTSLDMIKSQKLPESNTTGYKGVYHIRGKYVAKIVFQRKQYFLGTYSNIEDAAKARREGEILLFEGTAEYYERWQKRANEDPEWAKANPVSIQVGRNSSGELTVTYDPLV